MAPSISKVMESWLAGLLTRDLSVRLIGNQDCVSSMKDSSMITLVRRKSELWRPI